MSDRHTFITGTRVKSDGDGITVKEGSAIIFGNIVATKGNGIVIGNSDSVQSNEPKEPAYDIYTRTKQWWEKPVGILGDWDFNYRSWRCGALGFESLFFH
jgi:hypothetical protein